MLGNLENITDIENDNYTFIKRRYCWCFIDQLFVEHHLTGFFAFGCWIACGPFHYGSVVFCENKCDRNMNLLNAGKTICGELWRKAFFTTLVLMRFMEVWVLKDYLLTAYDPNPPYSALKSSTTFVRGWWNLWFALCIDELFLNNYGPFIFLNSGARKRTKTPTTFLSR
jgi:hypothetical protein